MGRRYRAKQRKNKSPNGVNVSHESIELTQWLHSSAKWNPTHNLRLSHFSSTGRGLMALRVFEKDSLLISVPPSMVISRSKVPCEPSWSTHEALSRFLVQEVSKGKYSSWYPYLQSLPTSYDVPFFISNEEAISALPSFWREPLQLQRKALLLKESPLMAWAHFTVNTRAVYHSDGGMALLPYMDMFNHSPDVSIRTKEAPDGAYEIYSGSQRIHKHEQVFINYGPHGNIKLFLEYGFWVPGNPHDSIPLDLVEDILRIFPAGRRRAHVVRQHGFDKNMSLGILWSGGDVDGVVASWNVYAVLDLLRGSEVNAIYRDNLEGLHRDLLIGLFEHKLQELKASAYALKASFFHLRTCRMAYELLAFYVKAIEASLAAPA